jgi:hypothetical protein
MMHVKRSKDIPSKHERLTRAELLAGMFVCAILIAGILAAWLCVWGWM